MYVPEPPPAQQRGDEGDEDGGALTAAEPARFPMMLGLEVREIIFDSCESIE